MLGRCGVVAAFFRDMIILAAIIGINLEDAEVSHSDCVTVWRGISHSVPPVHEKRRQMISGRLLRRNLETEAMDLR
jgi:hypothetical protein